MVRGIDSFRDWFQGYEDQYAIIGGTACDLLMTDEGLDFRATKDIDLVLIVELVDAAFGRRTHWFWAGVRISGSTNLACSVGNRPGNTSGIPIGSRLLFGNTISRDPLKTTPQ